MSFKNIEEFIKRYKDKRDNWVKSLVNEFTNDLENYKIVDQDIDIKKFIPGIKVEAIESTLKELIPEVKEIKDKELIDEIIDKFEQFKDDNSHILNSIRGTIIECDKILHKLKDELSFSNDLHDLKQSIKHCQEVIDKSDSNCKCKEDHRKLKNWLEELKELKYGGDKDE